MSTIAEETKKIAAASGEHKKLRVFVVSGKFSSGKDYCRAVIFNILKSRGYIPMGISFADHFKVDCVTKDKVDYAKVFGDARDAETRKLLQIRGSEKGLNVYGKHIWTDTATCWMQLQSERGIDYFIVADCRFPHEVEWALEDPMIEAHIIRLIAPKRTWARAMKEAAGDEELARQLCSHISETALDDTPTCKWSEKFHLVVDNDYGQELESVRIITEFVHKVLAQ